MASDPLPLGAEDVALLDRVAARVVELHMVVPAILALETAKPLTVVASQSLIFFEPLVQSLFRFTDYRRFAALVERRDVMEALILRIETGAEEDRVKRVAARRD
jgi:hypothetical protein